MPNIPPGSTTLAVMRQRVATRTEQPTPTPFTNVTIDTYNFFINESYRELVGLMVNEFEDYFVNPDNGNPYTFQTAGSTDYLYPLPNDFWKLLGMDCFYQPGNIQTAVTMTQFMRLERNKFQFFLGSGGIIVPQYKITGNQIWLIPMPPQAGLEILVRYVPVLPDMVDVGTIDCVGVAVGNIITIAALASVPQGPPVDGVLPDLTPQLQYEAIPEAAIPIDTDTVIQFNVGATTSETAANLASAMQRASPAPAVPWTTGSYAQDANVARVTSSGSVVTIQLLAPLAIVWSTLSDVDATTPAPGITLDPLPVATQWNPYGSWFNFGTVLNGWDTLVTVDAAIKVLEKQQQGTSSLQRKRDQLWTEVRSEANNRNAGQNARITSVRRIGGRGWNRFGGGTRGW